MSDLSDHCEGGYRYCSTMKRLAELEAQLAEARKALMVLSCLGNGDRPGNSEGNTIAQASLAKIEALAGGAEGESEE